MSSSESTSNLWPVPAEPTNLLAACAGETAPARDPSVRAIAACLGGAEIDTPSAPDDVAWSAVVETATAPVIVWAEPARGLPGEERAALGLEACRWMLGVEMMLDFDDPLASYVQVLRALHAAAPAAPAVLDVNTTRWLTRDETAHWTADDGIEPPVEVLWVQQVVATVAAQTSGAAGERRCWLHTHGLARCGRPELEMLEVPEPSARAAAELLDVVAALGFESPLPAPGELLAVGPELEVTVQPWTAVAPYASAGAAGGAADRGDAHDGVSAVVCAADPLGAYRKVWVWPSDVVTRLARNEAAVYQPARASARRAALARATWPALVDAVTAVAALPPGRAHVAVEAAYPVPGDETAREHLWFDADEIAGDGVGARLLSTPSVALAPAVGARTRLGPEQITDWALVTPEGRFGPEPRAALAQMLLALRGAGAAP